VSDGIGLNVMNPAILIHTTNVTNVHANPSLTPRIL